ncbi:MAG: diaminopimelate epimerase [Solirubrobacterales bacterium]|jgi:diaminopimelate epimerase
MRFAKAHGLGNDFILVAEDLAPAEIGPWARRLCDRHRGIGGDGVLLHAPAPDGIRMRLINADGIEGEISGNGLRCLAAFAVRRGSAPPRHVVHTVPGPRPVDVVALDASRYRIATDLGAPLIGSADIPVALDPPRAPVLDWPLEVAGRTVRITATSMGNPHCALFLPEPPDDRLVAEIGAPLERHPFFPRRTNVEFVTILSRSEIRVRFWERGVGPTQSSGTGSASAVVASILNGFVDRRVRVVCDGGVLEVDWPEGGHLHQVGEVEVLFEGDWLIERP